MLAPFLTCFRGVLQVVTVPELALEAHRQRVCRLQGMLLERRGRSSSVALSPRWGSNRVPSSADYRERVRNIDLSDMDNILYIGEDFVVVEPMVTMESLVAATLRRGLLPKVVPELRAMTVGGAIMGGAMESTSHRHGMFHDTVQECELLLGNGTVVLASEQQNAPLSKAVGGSYGCLCMLTMATIGCVPAQQHVALHYTWHSTVHDGIQALHTACSQEKDFVDGVALPFDKGYLCISGSFADKDTLRSFASDHNLISVGQSWDDFYWEHILDVSDCLRRGNASSANVLMEVTDYLFRFDRGVFWFVHADTWITDLWSFLHPVKLISFCVSHRDPISKFLFRWLFTTQRGQFFMHSLPEQAIASRLVIQDVFAPLEKAADCINFIHAQMPNGQRSPVWTWPVAGADSAKLFAPNGNSTDLMVNCGIYGRSASGGAGEFTRALEAWAAERGCRKLLYSQNYYTEDEFWQLYDEKQFRYLRETYAADDVFPCISAKVLPRADQALPRQGLFDALLELQRSLARSVGEWLL